MNTIIASCFRKRINIDILEDENGQYVEYPL